MGERFNISNIGVRFGMQVGVQGYRENTLKWN